jgi:uncharacterized protein
MLKVLPKQTASMQTRDGIRLDADIYCPDAEEKFPVLLMRQPYGREIASTVVYAHPSWYAAHGYIVVIQDVRGRGTSEGEFQLFTTEINDGEDAVNWVANLPGSNGNVGMYGFSYQGMTQLYAAAAKPPGLKTICPAMIGYDLYTDWAYEGGAFCFQTNLAWAIQLATESARLCGDENTYKGLFAASRNLPLYNPEIFKKLAPNSFYHQWLSHSQPDEYWKQLSPKTYFKDVDLPMFHIGGWFDTYLRGTVNLYQEMASKSQYRQQLLVGAWPHIPWGRKVGEVDFGINAMSPVDQMQISWFDQFLKGIDTGLLDQMPVWLFEMGSNIWQGFPKLPTPEQTSYFLATTGLGSIREDSGTLSTTCSETSCNDILVHDPWRSLPSLGGHAAIPGGVFERSHLDCRSDVLTYTSEPLGEDLHLVGNVTVEIWCSADKPSYDLCGILSQVYSDGRVFNLTQGYVRCENSNQKFPITIQLQATCTKIVKDTALRLSLSASCFPAYTINPGVSFMDAQIITLTVSSGGDFPSKILLPIAY